MAQVLQHTFSDGRNQPPYRLQRQLSAPSRLGELRQDGPTIKNVEEWVHFHAQQKKIKMDQESETSKIPRFRYVNPMLTQTNGEPISIVGSTAIKTPDDGNCLIHSILTSLSPSYCILSYKEKKIIGKMYRDKIKDLSIFNENEKRLLATLSANLPNTVAIKLGYFLEVNVICFDITGQFVDRSDPIDDHRINVFIIQDGTHFYAFPDPGVNTSVLERDLNDYTSQADIVVNQQRVKAEQLQKTKPTQMYSREEVEAAKTFLNENVEDFVLPPNYTDEEIINTRDSVMAYMFSESGGRKKRRTHIALRKSRKGKRKSKKRYTKRFKYFI
jgi:hypothetical protein